MESIEPNIHEDDQPQLSDGKVNTHMVRSKGSWWHSTLQFLLGATIGAMTFLPQIVVGGMHSAIGAFIIWSILVTAICFGLCGAAIVAVTNGRKALGFGILSLVVVQVALILRVAVS